MKSSHRKKLKRLAKNPPKFHSVSKTGYLRVNVRYPVDFVLRQLGEWHLVLFGHQVRMSSMRYYNFKRNGVVCTECGIKGQYFRLERHALQTEENRFHFNLYALDENGSEILMTKDHLIPTSLGGANFLSNLQPMCCKCNSRKGNKIKEEHDGKKL